MERNPWIRALIALLVIIAALYILSTIWSIVMMFADIITLFFLAWLLAFVLKPLANFLVSRYAAPRLLAAAAVYLGLFIVLLIAAMVIVPILSFQLAQLAANLPQYVESLPTIADNAQAELAARGINIPFSQWYANLNMAAQIDKMATLAIQYTLSLVTGIASMLFALLIILILSFYIMLDGDRLVADGIRLVPKAYQEEAAYLFESIDRSFGGFLRGQLIQGIVYALGTGVIMWIAGLGYVLLASTFSGIVMIIPFFGPFLAMLAPLIIAAFQTSPGQFAAVFIALLILQQLVLNVLAPKVMSQSLGMHPLLVFLAILVGGKVAGLAGAVFGVPVVGVINAMALYFLRGPAMHKQVIECENNQPTNIAEPGTSRATWRKRIAELINGAK